MYLRTPTDKKQTIQKKTPVKSENEQLQHTADLFKALSTEKRLQTYLQLCQGKAPQQIAEELDVSRQALQPYINDFKNTGLIKKTGKTYEPTIFTIELEIHLKRIQECVEKKERVKTIEKLLDSGMTRTEAINFLEEKCVSREDIKSAFGANPHIQSLSVEDLDGYDSVSDWLIEEEEKELDTDTGLLGTAVAEEEEQS